MQSSNFWSQDLFVCSYLFIGEISLTLGENTRICLWEGELRNGGRGCGRTAEQVAAKDTGHSVRLEERGELKSGVIGLFYWCLRDSLWGLWAD